MQFLSFQLHICYGKENNLNRTFNFTFSDLDRKHCDKNTAHPQCTGMEILAWFLVGGKYYSHT